MQFLIKIALTKTTRTIVMHQRLHMVSVCASVIGGLYFCLPGSREKGTLTQLTSRTESRDLGVVKWMTCVSVLPNLQEHMELKVQGATCCACASDVNTSKHARILDIWKNVLISVTHQQRTVLP